MAAATKTSLPPSCLLQSESDDEESFVVLGHSLPPESLLADTEALDAIDAKVVEESLKLTAHSLPQLETSTSSFPSIPKVKEQEMAPLLIKEFEVASTTSSSVDLSPDEIQNKIDGLIEENIKLKETLQQNNLAMKRQYDTLVVWQEDVMKVHQSHKEKFAETKKYIENLKVDNVKLAEALKMSQANELQLGKELKRLKAESEPEKSSVEEERYSMLKAKSDSELDEANKKITNLESQISDLQLQKLEKDVNPQPSAVDVQNLQRELMTVKLINMQHVSEAKKVKQEADSLQQILLEEIKVLKVQLAEKVGNTVTKETMDNVQEQLMAAQMHITKLELLRNEDKELVNSTKQEATAKMESVEKEMNESNNTITVLKAQLELYKADFEAERQAKESVKAEKEQIADDLRHLQRRNHQLLQEVEQLRMGDFVHVRRPEPAQATAPTAPKDVKKYQCPKCDFTFFNYQALENHVYRCIEIDSLF